MQKKIINTLINLTLLVSSIFCTLFVAEFAVRVYDKGVHSRRIFAVVHMDKELGWQPKVMFGERGTDKFRLMVIGDSFTHGLAVPVPHLYHQVLTDLLNIETFAIGGAGYGTYQEYLALKRYINEIQPDAILLQVFMNDFINNSRALEKKSYFNNNHQWRPYYENGETVFVNTRAPLPFPSLWIQSRLFSKIEFLHRKTLAKLAGMGYLHSVETDIRTLGTALPEFNDAINTTQELIRFIKEEAGDIPVLAFDMGSGEFYTNTFQTILSGEEIPFLKEVGDTMLQMKRDHEPITLQDGSHWNETGHRIIAEELADIFPEYLNDRYGVHVN